PGMYVEFEAKYDVKRVATLVNVRKGKRLTAFGVVLFKRADRNDIKSIKDIKGKRLAAVEESSWGGWQIGWYQLLELGINPYKDLSELTFLGSHDKVVYAVRDGKADIGNVRTDLLEKMAAEGKIRLEDFKPIYLNNEYGDKFPFWLSSKLYPEWPFGAATNTPMELNEKVAIALMSIPPDHPAAKAGRYDGWTVPANYQPIHEVLKVLKVTPYEHYGEITFQAVLVKYWKELVLAFIFGCFLVFAVFYFRRLNQRLTLTQAELENELQARMRTQRELQEASVELQAKHDELEKNLVQIKQMQDQIIMQEKLASLGSLTAGIAHEIKNPLNFVVNFSELITDLSRELNEELEAHMEKFDEDTRKYLSEIIGDLSANAEKIHAHGKRADSIVRNMLDHSRGVSGERRSTDINTFVEEYVQLGYHGMRASDSGFNVTIQTDYDPAAGSLEILPQDLSRVVLNIVNNACYAVREKQRTAEGPYTPTIRVGTKSNADGVDITIEDNGTGMPRETREKVFTPFFTTKPTGSGTGLGMSMSYDIVVQGHKGTLQIESEEGQYSKFILGLPRSAGGQTTIAAG
ncbi:MAG: PhnD/SsuA/transferrin family substrate-binding protein, partial [Thermodesulfovibrionales bacterium]